MFEKPFLKYLQIGFILFTQKHNLKLSHGLNQAILNDRHIPFQLHVYMNSFKKLIWKISHQSKEEGKDKESIQSGTTPDPGHHIGK